MLIEKSKLPKGMSYPLKSSHFGAALAGAEISISVHLIHGPRGSFEAFFWPPNPRVDHERLYVRSGMVNAADGRRAQRYLEEVTLPELVKWLIGILELDSRSPARMREKRFIRPLLPTPDWEPEPIPRE